MTILPDKKSKPRAVETAAKGALMSLATVILASPLLLVLTVLRAGWRWLKRRKTVSRFFDRDRTDRRPPHG